MAISTAILVLSCSLFSLFSTSLALPATYYQPGRKVMNIMDSCWRSDPRWASNRQALADCAKGFGSDALGGKGGAIYVVTDPSDDAANPRPGTLRYGVIQDKPMWIIFKRNMVIKLKNELLVNSYKTIDGRGAKVEIANGPCITIKDVSHVIVHGISIHDCKPGKQGLVRRAQNVLSKRQGSDGDAIVIFASSHVWIDHCYLARCTDGLIDIIHASTAITVSNNYFTQHDKVMLLGHQDGYTADKVMKVTLAFNHFGPGLIERMPRVRYGYAHVVNNYYEQWLMYAIGGSSNPTILSEGNYFMASNKPYSKKLVTSRTTSKGQPYWKKWKWRTSKDIFMNGAYFVPSGMGSCAPGYYGRQSFAAAPGALTPALTSDAGPLSCILNRPC